MRLYSALLVRNEAGSDRRLRDVLARCQQCSDGLLVLDDQSTDDTVAVATEFGAHVRVREPSVPTAWGNERSARQELWEFALEYCTSPTDWLLVADADMLLHGDPRPLCESVEVNSWSWVLYDCWNPTEYRSDAFWVGHRVPRSWLVAPRRVQSGWEARWPTRALHVGHFPENFPHVSGVAPDLYWLHHAYATPALRAAKHAQYLAQAHHLTEFERAHAESILTPP